ncbi:ArsR family transcriptional regulator [Veronia nyctiphanis]|uniref:ArsR family transcriptional regulator n=1 Tax=Veronia nyctiphanis TaxID=1278244 RepID=A0A4Q0YVF3_9GAMM|nr:Lrp/AsnC family transcriptional regulator [Veronia nyctiphanis]RXJ74194.1 ArsR family transcriptional regulator [Veronia nyctiphanis]
MKNIAFDAPIANQPLDKFDRAILRIVQVNNLLTHSEIGERIGLSASSVRRRLQSMRKQGVIKRDVSIVAPQESSVTLIVSLSFGDESIALYESFNRQMEKLSEVKQSYHVAGTEDYVLVVQGPSLAWYEDWSQKVFMSNEKIRRYDTKVVWSCQKFTTDVEI